jgi:hypothetical protein
VYGGTYLKWLRFKRIVNKVAFEFIDISRVAAIALRILFSFPKLSKNRESGVRPQQSAG